MTIAAAIIVILATLFDWFEFSENVFRNIALGLAALLLAAVIQAKAELRLQRDASNTLNAELREWRQGLRMIGAEIDPSDISRRLQATLQNSSRWAFSGGTGSWQRTNVLPMLSKITETDVAYHMQVVNILDQKLCDAYAHYRMTCNQTTGITGRSLALEILSSVLAVCWYGALTRIEPIVCFTTDYSPLRYDMSELECFITVANRSDPALAFGSNSWIFSHLEDEFTQDSKTLPRLDLSHAFSALRSRGKDPGLLRSDEVRALLDGVKVISGNSRKNLIRELQISDDEMQTIWERSGVSTG
ncbi:hypothetical protein [Rhodococcus opacus]|uniref:hypothetical protein n=1 Tax=Rhodococcus opacus TaxID=37919 RepID=UPI001F5790D5|nr:hypothetical protein [Rhodococcus opacus]UNN05265.1 hypothetical protein MOO23_40325 [Rhodococcus opacus]